MKNIKKQKKKKSLAGKFFTIVFIIVFVYILAFGAYVAYTYLNDDNDDNYFAANSNILPNMFAPKLPERTNVLILGVDNDKTRTDTIMVASYNSVNHILSIISVPRDTLVEVPADRWEVMCQNIPNLANYSSRETKINHVHNFAGEEHNTEYTMLQVEELLGVSLDYYFKVDCDAFKYIVDSIGGIEFDVEQRMYYSDPTQDLYIDLYPGIQTLDGDKAEQLVRFRTYAQADLTRIKVQQEFMKVFLETALSKSTILANPTAYLNTVIKYIDTDFGITDAVKYIGELSNFSSDNVVGYTLPGQPRTLSDGGSYFIPDYEAIEELVYDVFEKPLTADEDIKPEDSFSKTIQVLNGGYTSGMAKNVSDRLEAAGYAVDDIGDYDGQKKDQTKIYVQKAGQGEDLVQFFDDAKVIVSPDNTEEYDIVIIVGKTEALKEPGEVKSNDAAQDSFSCSIEVLNGGYTSGMAKNVSERLSAVGYKVEAIGDYNGSKQAQTRIYVQEKGKGEDLIQYFDNAKVTVSPENAVDYDIVIIIGSDEKRR